MLIDTGQVTVAGQTIPPGQYDMTIPPGTAIGIPDGEIHTKDHFGSANPNASHASTRSTAGKTETQDQPARRAKVLAPVGIEQRRQLARW